MSLDDRAADCKASPRRQATAVEGGEHLFEMLWRGALAGTTHHEEHLGPPFHRDHGKIGPVLNTAYFLRRAATGGGSIAPALTRTGFSAGAPVSLTIVKPREKN